MISPQQLLNPKWPDAIWDVSGAFSFDRELIAFHELCKKELGIENLFSIAHGAPYESIWNSGRICAKLHCTEQQIKSAIKAYADQQIALYLTFSNTELEEEHLSHGLSNAMCSMVTQLNPTGNNAIILSSNLLNQHIKDNYPTLKRINSILKITCERGKGKLDTYKKYLDEFDQVMIHPDDVIDPAFLAQLPEKERCILLINESCIRNCPIRHKHYQSLSINSISPNDKAGMEFSQLQAKNGCLNLAELMSDGSKSVLALNTIEMQEIYELGFRHFKLQGRGTGNALPQLFNLMQFGFKNDLAQENGMHALMQHLLEELPRYCEAL